MGAAHSQPWVAAKAATALMVCGCPCSRDGLGAWAGIRLLGLQPGWWHRAQPWMSCSLPHLYNWHPHMGPAVGCTILTTEREEQGPLSATGQKQWLHVTTSIPNIPPEMQMFRSVQKFILYLYGGHILYVHIWAYFSRKYFILSDIQNSLLFYNAYTLSCLYFVVCTQQKKSSGFFSLQSKNIKQTV